ncbi:hypothetical protein M741_07670, partial [Neisseria gonorrhoeae NOR_2011_03-06]
NFRLLLSQRHAHCRNTGGFSLCRTASASLGESEGIARRQYRRQYRKLKRNIPCLHFYFLNLKGFKLRTASAKDVYGPCAVGVICG